METQPTAIRIQCGGKGEIWDAPNQCHDWAYIEDGPVGTLTCASTNFSKRKTKKLATLLAPAFTTSRSGVGAMSIAIVPSGAPATGGATSFNTQVTGIPIGMTNTATVYCRFRPIFDPPVHYLLLPRFKNRQLLYHHLLCMRCSFDPSLACQHKSQFSSLHPPYRPTLSLGIYLTGMNIVRALPLSLPSCQAALPPKEAPALPSTRLRYSIRQPSPVPSFPRMPSHRCS